MLEIYQTIADTIEDCFLVCDRRGMVTATNAALRQKLLRSERELLGRPLSALVAADFAEQARALVAAAGESPALAEEFVFVLGNGDFLSLPITYFKRGDYLYLVSNAKYDELARLRIKLDREIANAVRIHGRCLPERLPVGPAVEFAAHYLAADDLGGDLYGVFKVEHGLLDDFFEQYICFLADVSGHGLDSAMLATFVSDTIASWFSMRHQAGQVVSPKEIVDFFSAEYLGEAFPEDFFVAIFLGLFDIRNREFLYSSAGFQAAPLVAAPGGEITKLKVGGLPISTALPLELLAATEHRLDLEPGMSLLFSTDGLVEQRCGEQVYDSRLEQIFTAAAHSAPEQIIAAIQRDFAEFTAGGAVDDDITLVAARLKGP